MSAAIASNVPVSEDTMTRLKEEREHPVCVLSEKQKDVLRTTWKPLGDSEEQLQQVGITLFHRIFEIAPQAIALFPKFRDVPAEEREEDEAFRSHAYKVMETIGLALSFLDDVDTLVGVLEDLGSMHVIHGIQDAHFEVVGSALIWTLQKEFGVNFTEDICQAWTSMYCFVADCMKKGLHEAYDLQGQ